MARPPSRSTASPIPQLQQQQQPPPPPLNPHRKTIYDRNLNRTKASKVSRSAFDYLFIEMINYAHDRATGVTDLETRLAKHGYPLGLKLLDLLLYRGSAPSYQPQASLGQQFQMQLQEAQSSLPIGGGSGGGGSGGIGGGRGLGGSSSSSVAPGAARPTLIKDLLRFINGPLWLALFERNLDGLTQSAENPAEYMITDNDPMVNRFISVPQDMNQLNCAAFVAGIIEGVCDGAGFKTLSVSAHWAAVPGENEDDGDNDNGISEDSKNLNSRRMWPGRTIYLLKFTDEVMERDKILRSRKNWNE